MSIVCVLIIFILGAIFGGVAHSILTSEYDGRMYVDSSNDEKDLWTLEYDGEIEALTNKKSIRLRIVQVK